MEHIRIMGQDYELILDNRQLNQCDHIGEYRGREQKIIIDERLSKSRIGQTILHELLESLVDHLDLQIPHEMINQLDAGLTQIIRDNPNIIKKYILGGK